MGAYLSCFKAYDIRGKVPEELHPELAARVALAFVDRFHPETVVVGRDMRLSSEDLATAVIDQLLACGVDIIDLGLCGTEEVYHAVFSGEAAGVGGGIMVTASHNPAEYNGMKLVQQGARPVSGDTGLNALEAHAADDTWVEKKRAELCGKRGQRLPAGKKEDYVRHLLGYVRAEHLAPLKLVVNSGNGTAGAVVDLLETYLPFQFVKLHHKPDGTFPNGVPNPLLPEKRSVTADAVLSHGADMGIAWDGDFDRCFFFDEQGRFIEGYYIVGLLATAILKQHPGSTILHDPRLVWNTVEMVEKAGGVALMTKTGHAFIKEKMRQVNAVYGGEMSAHHYFRMFGYCDSGMIPWLLVAQCISETGLPLSRMVDERITAFPVSGEINSRVADPDRVLALVEQRYTDGERDTTDGISITYPTYRFNLRQSNTEPVLRLNVETRGDAALLEKKTHELLTLIRES
ncbi:MAG: phosphomannomutase [Desulfobulbus propionicus]|nr:MAG: phosphomannomutase [Desulfobulbus propionicus]